eukprot:gene7925-9311_t
MAITFPNIDRSDISFYTGNLLPGSLVAYLGHVPDESTYKFLNQFVPYDQTYTNGVIGDAYVYQGVVGSGSTWRLSYGPFAGQLAIIYNSSGQSIAQLGTKYSLRMRDGELLPDDPSQPTGVVVRFYNPPVTPLYFNVTSSTRTVSTITFELFNYGTAFSSCQVMIEKFVIPCFTKPTDGLRLKTVMTPEYYGGPYPLMVSVDGAPFAKLGVYIDYYPPSIQSISSVTSSGGQTMVTGSDFYKDPALLSFIFGNKTLSPLYGIQDHMYVYVLLPPGTGSVICSVRVFDKRSSNFTFTYAPPVITSASVSQDTVSNLYTMTVTGTSFGNNINVIKLNGFLDPPTGLSIIMDHKSFRFSFKSARHDTMFSVTVDNQTSNSFPVTYPPPTLLSVESVPTDGGHTVVLGNNFNVDPMSFSLLFNGVYIQATVLSDNTMAMVEIPSGTGSLPVLCKVGKVQSLGVTFTYNKPFIRSYYLDGTTLTIYGDSFGNDTTKITVNGIPNLSNLDILQPHRSMKPNIICK